MALEISEAVRNGILGAQRNQVTNGTFDTDTTGWTATDSTLSAETGGANSSAKHLRVTETGSANPGKAYQDLTLSIGKLYVIELYFKLGTSSSGQVTVGTTGDDDSVFTSPLLTDATFTQHRFAFVATATTQRLVLLTTDATATEYSDFDEVVVYPADGSIKEMFRKGFIELRTGSQPSDPNGSVIGGTLVVTITKDGGTWTAGEETNGLDLDVASDGSIGKPSADTWQGTAVATTSIGYGVYYPNETDDGTAHTTEDRPRIVGQAGVGTGVFQLATLSATSGSPIAVQSLALGMPESA